MAKPKIRVVSGAIMRNRKYLITQRMEKAVLPLLWEFPGGRVEEGESDEDALARELHERLGIRARVGSQLTSTEREYDTYIVALHLYECELGPVEPQALKVNDLRWVHSTEFENFEFTPADQNSMDALLFGAQGSA